MLPITHVLAQVDAALSSANNVVLQAEPGAGKSTKLPLSLLGADWLVKKKIIMLEPRRVAAKSIAHYLSRGLGESLGQSVGYQVRNDKRVSINTKLEIVTEGILTRKIQNDPELADYGLIIFDEFHERSINADLSLMLALEIQQTIREDLRLLVMSATIDTKKIASYIGNAKIIECPGRTYPVALNYSRDNNEPIANQVLTAIKIALDQGTTGDILVFLPGRGEIQKCLESAQVIFTECLCLALFGAQSIEQQEQALRSSSDGRKRIIFSTNIAETSLTIEGITYVIDSGLEKTLSYDPVSAMSRLQSHYISKASANQRKGRAGRLQAGSCLRLWSKEKHSTLQDYQSEEILSADLSMALLELYQWGMACYESTNWLTAPPRAHYDSARATLLNLGLADENNKLSELGTKAINTGLPPRLAAMLLQAEDELEKNIACELAALLSERDIFEHGNGTDIVERLLAVQDYKLNKKAALKSYPLKRAAIEQLLINTSNYRRALGLKKAPLQITLSELQTATGRLLLFSYPDRLAKQRGKNAERYLLANGRGAFLSNNDALVRSEWIVVAECDAQKNEGRIFRASAIADHVVLDVLESKINEEHVFELDAKKEVFSAHVLRKYGALELSRNLIVKPPSEVFSACINEHIKKSGLNLLNWTDKCEDLTKRAQWLSQYMNEFTKLSKTQLSDTSEEWLLPYLSNIRSIKELKKVDIYSLLMQNLSWDEQQRLNIEAPIKYSTPSGKNIAINYHSDGDPTVSVKLQEMFGEIETPKIAGGQVPLRFELLSPAHRPIQTTNDLANFWKSSYFQVAKDMRGRYPKHRWPEQPLLEKPGRSIKPSRKK